MADKPFLKLKLSILNDSTKIYVVPDKANLANAEEEDFKLIARKLLENDEMLTAETYSFGEKTGFEKYVVLYGFDTSHYRGTVLPVVVSSVMTVMNDEGDIVECIEGFQGNNKVQLKAKDDVTFSDKGVSEGTFLRVALTEQNEVADFTKIYDPSEDEKYTSQAKDLNTDFLVYVGYVNETVSPVAYLSETLGGDITRIVNTNGVPVLIYDKENKNNVLTPGVINDANTYVGSVNEASRIVLVTGHMSPKMMVIYK